MGGLGADCALITWSKPSKLINVAGKGNDDHVLDSLSTLPNPQDIELVNIVGYLGDQIEDHLREYYPHLKTHYIVQENPRANRTPSS